MGELENIINAASKEGKFTRLQYLIRSTLIQLALEGQPANVFMVIEAASSTAIEHPEWDMEELKTWDEWTKELSEEGSDEINR